MKKCKPQIKELSESALNYAMNKQNYLQLADGQINMTYTYMDLLEKKPVIAMEAIIGDNPDEATLKDFEAVSVKVKCLHKAAFDAIHIIYEALKEGTENEFNGFVARFHARKDPNSIFKEE